MQTKCTNERVQSTKEQSCETNPRNINSAFGINIISINMACGVHAVWLNLWRNMNNSINQYRWLNISIDKFYILLLFKLCKPLVAVACFCFTSIWAIVLLLLLNKLVTIARMNICVLITTREFEKKKEFDNRQSAIQNMNLNKKLLFIFLRIKPIIITKKVNFIKYDRC